MPKKKEIDYGALIKMIEEGKLQKEIMEAFDFNTSTQLKVAYLNALTESGKAPGIVSGRAKAAAGVKKEVKVNKRGSLIIPKLLVDDMGFEEGETFMVRKTRTGLSLRMIEEETEEEYSE